MEPTTHLVTRTRQGQLRITDEVVVVCPRREEKQGATLVIPRSEIAGVSNYRAHLGRTLLLHLRDGSQVRVDAVPACDALRVVTLLGYARMLLPATEPTAWARKSISTQQGRLQVTSDAVLLRSRLNPFAQPHWQAPRNLVTGISSRRVPGLRMQHEVSLHTVDGARLSLGSLTPDRTIALTRTLGHVTAMPQVPDVVAQTRAALWHEWADPAAEGTPEALAVERVRPTLAMFFARSSARLGQRELRLNTRVASIVAVFLLGIYLAAAVAGGSTFARAGSFLPVSGGSAPVAQPGDIFTVAPAVSPAAKKTSQPKTKHK